MNMYGPRHPILARASAAATLCGLLAGIPAVLLTFFWPVDVPTLDDLAAPAEPVVVKALLLGVVWTCWALFACAVLVELVGTTRARRGPTRLPFQRLAAYLITTVAVAATTPAAGSRGMVPAAVTTVAPPGPSPAAEPRCDSAAKAYTTYVVKPRDTLWTIAKTRLGDPMRYREIVALNQGRTMDDGQTFTRGGWLRPGWTLRLPADARKEPHRSGRTHTVSSGDSLWRISERRLGDGSRYREIFRLNRGRIQPDGKRLTRPGVLEPGWRLTLPGREREPREHARHHRAPQRATPPARQGAEPPPLTQQPAPARTATPVVVLPDGGMMALSFSAGVAVALASARLHHRRRLSVPAAAEPVSPPAPVPHPPAVRALERAHIRACADSEQAPRDDFELVTSAFTIDPPVMLKAGTRGDEAVAVALSGLNLALTGPGADDCVRAVVLDLLTQADQHRAEIVIPEADATRWFGESVLTPAPHLPGLRLTATLDEAVDHLEEQFVARRRILRDSEAGDISQLRETDPGEPLPALLLTACSADGHPYLDRLMGLASAFGVGAVLTGRSASGTTCTIDQDHRVTDATGSLAEELRDATLFHLTQDAAGALLRTLAAGNGMPAGEPATAPAEPGVPPPSHAAQPVRFGIVGEPCLEVNGKAVDLSRRTKALELLVLLAVHPKGLQREEICDHLWPELDETLAGYRFHAALKDLRAALREAAGPGEKAGFIERASRTYRIAAQHIDVDLWALHRALAEARTAAGEEAKTAALEAVAGLCRGRLGQGLRYDWLDQDHRWPLTVTSVKALLQLGALHEHAGRTERALEVYDQAHTLDPDMEAATRSAIRLLTSLGRTDEARQRARHLKARLSALGVAPSAETQTVLQRLNTAVNPLHGR